MISLLTVIAIPFPEFDRVAFSIGPLDIRWYGLSYIAGLLLGWYYIRKLLQSPKLWANNQAPFEASKVDDLLIYTTVGVIIGGRLGYVFFYNPSSYLANPIDIFKIWQGGMAFHGALVGSGIALWLFSRSVNANAKSVMDLASAAVPLGLVFGRLANFINGELFGRPTSVPWGMIFPDAARLYPADGNVPRHPSQLYEAALEGLVLFIVLRLATHTYAKLERPGFITGMFLIGYALARSFCELFRQYDPLHAFSAYGLTPGIVYCIPMFLLGIWFLRTAKPAIQHTAR